MYTDLKYIERKLALIWFLSFGFITRKAVSSFPFFIFLFFYFILFYFFLLIILLFVNPLSAKKADDKIYVWNFSNEIRPTNFEILRLKGKQFRSRRGGSVSTLCKNLTTVDLRTRITAFLEEKSDPCFNTEIYHQVTKYCG